MSSVDGNISTPTVVENISTFYNSIFAAYSSNMNTLVQKTKFVVELINLPLAEDDIIEVGIAAIKAVIDPDFKADTEKEETN